LQIIEEKTIEKVPEVIKNIENISKKEKDQEIKEMYFQQIQSLKQGLRLQKEEQKEEIRETKSKLLLEKKEREKKEKQALFLQSVLSKDTKEIIGLQHQIKMSTNNIKNYLTHLKLTPQEEMNFKEYQDILDLVLIENEKIHSIVEFVTQANYDLKASEIKEDIIQFIKQYLLEVHPTIAKKYGEKILKIKFKNDPKFIKEFKPLEITIILDNIISNSQKALANILEISFTINKNTKKLEISFKDDGRGISEDDIDNIFDFGYTTTDGSGVGLHHIKEILKGIKGEIKINNKLPKGTEVIIQIPK
jgi:signal transduction histidine kinase